MKKVILCNVMPIYKEAPVSSLLLKEYTEKVITALMEKAADEHYLVIPKGAYEENVPEGLNIIEAERSFGFVYGNHSALLKVLEGEKPIPSCSNKGVSGESVFIVTAEELLGMQKKKVYIGGNAKKNGTYEFTVNVTPRAILETCGTKAKFKGMYFGYPMGYMIKESMLDIPVELKTDYIQLWDETDCVLDRLLALADRFGEETCGRCVFGHEGVTQIRMILSDISLKKGKTSDIELLLDLCSEMKQQSLCEIGETAANTVISAMDCFKDEIEEHITKKNCRAGVCSKFVTYHILPDLCTGCNACADECGDDAILGKKRFIHVIDQEECTQCGACVEACEEEAIVKAGAVKPRCPKKPIPCSR